MYSTADILRQLRLEHHLSQLEMAKKVGVSRASYSLWENGIRPPKRKNCERICKEFDVDMGYLLGLTIEKKQNDENIIKNVVVPIYMNGKVTDDSITIPISIIGDRSGCWGEVNEETHNIVIYDRVTKQPLCFFVKL